MGYLWGTPLGIFTGPTANVTTGPVNLPPTTTFVRVLGGGGTVVLNLPTAAQGVTDGQWMSFVTFDAGGAPTILTPAAGDNIVGGPAWNLAAFGASATIEARVVGTVVNWIVIATNTFETYHFPLQPTLAAGAQGPIPLGTIFVPQGPRYLHSAWTSANAALTGGSLTVSMTGLASSPATFTITNPANGTGTLFSPGNANRITVPNTGPSNATGTLLTASVSTVAGFGGATGVDFTVCFW
jgi:hypothetical protein